MVANPSTPESQGTSSMTTTPVDAEAFQERISSLQSDNAFLRSLVEQSSKEKSVLMTTIEGLQKENLSAFPWAWALLVQSEQAADMSHRSEQRRRLSPKCCGPVAAATTSLSWKLVFERHRHRYRKDGRPAA